MHDQTSGLNRGAPSKLFERDSELAAVERALKSAQAGRGAVLVFEGPPGIGKSRLLEAAQAAAEQRDMLVLRARASILEREFAYGLVGQLFGAAVQGDDPDAPGSLFNGAAALAQAVFSGRPVREAEDPDAAFATLHGLYWLCANLAGRSALLISVDDAHWGDQSSLRWLDFAARRLDDLPVAIVISARPQPPDLTPSPLGGLAANPLAQVLRPQPLSAPATARIVETALPEPETAFIAACHEATRGNPFLVTELVRQLVADGVAPTARVGAAVRSLNPENVARSILERLTQLPVACGALARSAALLGDDVPLWLATRHASLEDDAASTAAAELARASILDDGRPLRFVHPIVRATIYGELPAAERSTGHRRAAALLHEAGESPERVGAHLLESEPGQLGWAGAVLGEAADRALARGAPDAAIAWLTRAAEEPMSRTRRAETLLALGRAEMLAHGAGAIEHLQGALELAEDPGLHAAAAAALGTILMLTNRVPNAVAMLDRAVAAVGDVDPELAAVLEADMIAAARSDLRTRPTARVRLDAAVRRGAGRGFGGRLILVNQAVEMAMAGASAARAAALAREALSGGEERFDDVRNHVHFLSAVRVLFVADEFVEAQAHLDAALRRSQDRGSLVGFASVSSFRAELALRRGDIPTAEAEARGALSAAREQGLDFHTGALTAHAVRALVERGDHETAGRLLEESGLDGEVPLTYFSNLLLNSRGMLRLAEGRLEEGLADLLECGRRMTELEEPNPALGDWRSAAALALAALGRRSEADPLAAEELALARGFGAPRAVAIALRTTGLINGGPEGIASLSEAVAVLEGSGAVLERARSLTDLGAMLRRSGQRSAARAPLREGLDLALRSGALALVRRARTELAATGARPRRELLTGVEALTPSERRVALMAASGQSNAQIAQALFVTRSTVEDHLAATYRKLEIAGRAQLGAAMREAG